ncbi:MAG: hypothetical protein IPI67_37330 [Myxococcales bacterium]|nr:hypothetical protein [Myxococcales bacterium]
MERSPVFLDRDAEARCQMDEDGNGLDDEIEQQLAACFVPAFRFDADEPSSSLLPNEPVAGFSAYRIQGSTPGEILIRFEMVAMWRRDGGFPNDDELQCADSSPVFEDQAHEGDTWGTRIDVRVSKDQAWRAELAEFSTCWPAEMHGTHPVVYGSAGKHHAYCSSGVSEFDVAGPGTCTDPHRGNGELRVPSSLFRISTSWLPIPTSDGNMHWGNVCTFVRTGQKVVASRLQPTRLGNLGFAGQTLWGDFYTGGVTGPGFLLAPGGAFTLDADGDGRPDSDRVAPDDAVTIAADLCPLDSGPEQDADGDHLYGACDFDPNFRQTWVGIGTPGKPPVPQAFNSWSPIPTGAFGGFLDTDQDGPPDGVDSCPKLPLALTPGGGVTVSNRWGEDLNWPPHPISNNELGALQRGETCDPYPAAHSTWNPKISYNKTCGSPGWVSTGQDVIGVTTRVSRGVSANDPFWLAPKTELPATFPVQSYRCACRDENTGAPLSGASCITDPNSDCYRGSARRAVPSVYDGRGFRPIDRPSCTRNPETWCDSFPLAVPRFGSEPSGVSWRWLDELKAFGPASPTPHFAAEDVSTEPASPFSGARQGLKHQYAVWTLPEISAPPATSIKQSQFSFHYDPEYDPQHRADQLWDLQSDHSIRMRASFSEQPVADLVSNHSTFSLKPPCAVLTIDQQLALVKLWFGPDPVKPEVTGFSGLRLLAHDGGVVTRAVVVRPAEGSYATLALGTAAAQGWLATAAVQVAPMGGSAQSTPVLAALAAPLASTRSRAEEPALIVVERSSGVARWALLAPVASADQSITYEIAGEGTLPGAVSPSAVLIADPTGMTVALVDTAGGRVDWFSTGSRLWTDSALPSEIAGLDGAALALWGSHLLVAGGARDGALGAELWDLGLFGGPVSLVRSDLPARRGPALSVSPGGERIIYVGGSDASGARHDDVWHVGPGAAATARLFGDTTRASTLELGITAVVDSVFEGALRALTLDLTRPELVATRLRAARGWQEARVADEGLACAPTDALGGRLCPLGTEWWSSPGAVPCGATGNACEGSRGSLAASLSLPGSAVAADTDGRSVWLLRDKSIERWSVAGSTPALIASAVLPAKARALSINPEGAVVATDAGVTMVRAIGAALSLDAPLALCGRPLEMTALGEASWAVVTTVGLAIVGAPAGEPLALQSMSLLVPLSPKPIALGTDPASTALCKKADAILPGAMVDALAKLVAVAAGEQRLLVASGPMLFDVGVRDLAHPTLGGQKVIVHPLEALRVDPAGGRAYGVSKHGQHRPVIDLRGGGLALAGSHGVESWVRRRDRGELVVRVLPAQVEIAKVVP